MMRVIYFIRIYKRKGDNINIHLYNIYIYDEFLSILSSIFPLIVHIFKFYFLEFLSTYTYLKTIFLNIFRAA